MKADFGEDTKSEGVRGRDRERGREILKFPLRGVIMNLQTKNLYSDKDSRGIPYKNFWYWGSDPLYTEAYEDKKIMIVRLKIDDIDVINIEPSRV